MFTAQGGQMPFCQIGCKFTTKIAYTQILEALFGKNRVYSMISGVRRYAHACMVWAYILVCRMCRHNRLAYMNYPYLTGISYVFRAQKE